MSANCFPCLLFFLFFEAIAHLVPTQDNAYYLPCAKRPKEEKIAHHRLVQAQQRDCSYLHIERDWKRHHLVDRSFIKHSHNWRQWTQQAKNLQDLIHRNMEYSQKPKKKDLVASLLCSFPIGTVAEPAQMSSWSLPIVLASRTLLRYYPRPVLALSLLLWPALRNLDAPAIFCCRNGPFWRDRSDSVSAPREGAPNRQVLRRLEPLLDLLNSTRPSISNRSAQHRASLGYRDNENLQIHAYVYTYMYMYSVHSGHSAKLTGHAIWELAAWFTGTDKTDPGQL